MAAFSHAFTVKVGSHTFYFEEEIVMPQELALNNVRSVIGEYNEEYALSQIRITQLREQKSQRQLEREQLTAVHHDVLAKLQELDDKDDRLIAEEVEWCELLTSEMEIERNNSLVISEDWIPAHREFAGMTRPAALRRIGIRYSKSNQERAVLDNRQITALLIHGGFAKWNRDTGDRQKPGSINTSLCKSEDWQRVNAYTYKYVGPMTE